MLDTARLYVRFTRPFTLLPPLMGVISGAITAWGSASNPHVLAGQPRQWTWSIALMILLGSGCAAMLNAASNVINQYYDFENDKINKPTRPFITGEISMGAAFRLAIVLYTIAVVPTWLIVAWPRVTFAEKLNSPLAQHECFALFVLGLIFTLVYSAPALGRTKANAFLANLTIAIPRGCLLKVAGWSMVASVFHVEPWFIGSIFFLFPVWASSPQGFLSLPRD